jgi:Family of unknown function (DUF6527)
MRRTSITHEFVEYIPAELAEGVLYVSITYRTAVHRCVCGCGNKVVTPISPADWQLLYDGDTISLNPSIGNWNFPCRSHYWIRHDQIRWSGSWTDDRIAAGRARDDQDRERYFAHRAASALEPQAAAATGVGRRISFVWLRRLVRRRR